MTSRKDALIDAVFGSRIAEDEVDELHSYFVETEQWRKVLAGEVDVVFGAKGSGKSALYSLLVAQKEKLRLGRRTMFLAAENPRGAPAFRDLTSVPPLDEEQFRGLWKLYFLAISAGYLRHHVTVSRSNNEACVRVCNVLSQYGLLAPNANLMSKLAAAYDYLRKYFPTVEGSVTDPNTGLAYTGKITLGEPTQEERELGFYSLDDLLGQLNLAFKQENITAWLVLDRLDVAFTDSHELEGNALRSLFRTYLDVQALSQIKIKIFLRDDIWRKILGPGFREASHVTRTLNLEWDQPSLLNLLVRRIASNLSICDHYGIDADVLLGNSQLQSQFFYNVFPNQIDIGKSKSLTIDWMLSRTADGSRRTAPRELIHLLLQARDEQIKRYQLGNPDPEVNQLFDKFAIRSALPAVSKARYEQTLCAENPTLKVFLDKLEGEKTQQTPDTLAKVWRCTAERATEVAERLVEAGFFERRGSKDSPSYWVPFLYRDALNMIQGSA